MFFVAEEARRIMARLGVRSSTDLVGRVDLLEADDAIERWKERGPRLSALLHAPGRARRTSRFARCARRLSARRRARLAADRAARPAIDDGTPVEAELDVRNVNRTVGGLLSHTVTKAT
jgi:hypothetical protein